MSRQNFNDSVDLNNGDESASSFFNAASSRFLQEALAEVPALIRNPQMATLDLPLGLPITPENRDAAAQIHSTLPSNNLEMLLEQNLQRKK